MINRLIVLLLCTLSILCLPGQAETRTPYAEGLNMISGYCADLDNKSTLSLHLCAQQVDAGSDQRMAYILYVEIFGPDIIRLDDNSITLVHRKSGNHISYAVDDIVTANVLNAEPSFDKITVHYMILPEIVVRLLREGEEFTAYVHIKGKKYNFIPTENEYKEMRMIAGVEVAE